MAESKTSLDLFQIDEQVAIVTGGAGRLGSAMCDALAEAGAHVVVASRNLGACKSKAHELGNSHREAMAHSVDITDKQSVEAMTKEVLRRFGRIDILVNNAYSGESAPIHDMTPEQWMSAMNGGLTGAFLCSQSVLRSMEERKAGAIVNISSIYGMVAPDDRIYGRSGLNNPCNYGAAKAGLIQFTRWLAARFAPKGIRANSISPGGIYDEALRSRPDYEDVFVPAYRARTPLGRMGNTEDVKGAVLFLASGASQWVTGHNLVVDGGWTAW